jgi:hypothetical protein
MGDNMDNIKDVAQIIDYLTLSIAGPLALMEYLKAKKRDRLVKEYNTYHELDNRFFDYQKLPADAAQPLVRRPADEVHARSRAIAGSHQRNGVTESVVRPLT